MLKQTAFNMRIFIIYEKPIECHQLPTMILEFVNLTAFPILFIHYITSSLASNCKVLKKSLRIKNVNIWIRVKCKTLLHNELK